MLAAALAASILMLMLVAVPIAKGDAEPAGIELAASAVAGLR